METKLLTHQPVFQLLQDKASELPHLKDLFAVNSQRAEQMTISGAGLTLDFSKQRLDADILASLEQLFEDSNLPEAICDLFAGKPVNTTEDRPALHTQLRVPQACQTEVFTDIENQLKRLESIVSSFHSGVWRGFSGKRITDVVNLGVGGSDLGPMMVCHALKEYAEPQARELRVHFASTIDGSQLFDLLTYLDPETTVFLIVSKSFTTVDTLSNANTALSWLSDICPQDDLIRRCHFIGISADAGRMTDWGLPQQNQLCFWPWVGGRFSLWSTVGLSIALRLGAKVFRQLLAGAHAMDQHFFNEAPLNNIPVVMALVGIWNINVLGIKTHAILPYDGRLEYLPAYLEQLEMESNGKSVSHDGRPLNYSTCPILWGEVGANAQHAFYQLLHQGTEPIVADFIIAANRYESYIAEQHYDALAVQHELNLANCLAQSRVLAFGQNESDNISVHQICRGNQGSSTLLMDELNPYSLGSLIACYEHKVFTQAKIWNINPFDQWGVELGKQVARQLQPLFERYSKEESVFTDLDSSTLLLSKKISRFRYGR